MKRLFSLTTLLVILLSAFHAKAEVKNIIFMIGDGMGPQQISQAIMYRQAMKPENKKLSFEKLYANGRHAIATTISANSVVTDSAAAATALACGVKTRNDMIGKDANGKACTSILRIAKKMGKSTGLVTTTRISHATPASFASANVARQNENEIAQQYVDEAVVDIFLGGGARQFLPKNESFSSIPECKKKSIDSLIDGKGKRTDSKNLITEAKAKGYTFVCTKNELLSLPLGSKILGTFAHSHLPLIQERQNISSLPSLAEMTEVSLKHLSQNEKGFFVMIEGGEIDFSGHRNDAATQLKETLDFDNAIAVAMKYVDEHPDTLLLITADHETGGFSMSYQQFTKEEKPLLLASRERYSPRYNNPTSNVFTLFEKQTASFDAILEPSLKLLEKSDKSNAAALNATLSLSAKLLVKNLKKKSAYTLTEEEAKHVLMDLDAPPSNSHQHNSHPFSTTDKMEYAGNKLATALSTQSFVVWASGNHTHIPVDVFAYSASPKELKSFPALMDNTDIFKLMKAAFEN